MAACTACTCKSWRVRWLLSLAVEHLSRTAGLQANDLPQDPGGAGSGLPADLPMTDEGRPGDPGATTHRESPAAAPQEAVGQPVCRCPRDTRLLEKLHNAMKKEGRSRVGGKRTNPAAVRQKRLPVAETCECHPGRSAHSCRVAHDWEPRSPGHSHAGLGRVAWRWPLGRARPLLRRQRAEFRFRFREKRKRGFCGGRGGRGEAGRGDRGDNPALRSICVLWRQALGPGRCRAGSQRGSGGELGLIRDFSRTHIPGSLRSLVTAELPRFLQRMVVQFSCSWSGEEREGACAQQADTGPSGFADTPSPVSPIQTHLQATTPGLVGLHNIGQTCCLNTLIQVFVMNVDFTKILKRMTVPRAAEDQRRNVPFQLLLLLEKMQDSRQKAVRPMELAYCLQKYNVPLYVQHDAAQLYLTVWNLIKDQITDVDLVERLEALYTVRIKETLVCLECNTESSRDSSLLTLPLSMFDMDSKPLRSLEEALRCFFQPKELANQSKCFCQSCGRKTSGKQVLKLTCLPPTLTIHLLRFSIRNSRTEKICHSLHFPESLDFSQVLPTEQDLGGAGDKSEGHYELFAVIAHAGMADFGHYCAYIRNPVAGQWFCFNDSHVCWVSWEDIQCTYGHHRYRWQETAYLLVYTKLEA
ncbi:ubl carboxyl-terminal hydrolase 18 [Ctenodactylus gundi]